jgi:hypothetical protein
MDSLSSGGRPSPGGARRDSGRGDRTLNASLCAAGGSAYASPRRHGWPDHSCEARDSIYDEYSAVRPPYCDTFCFAHRITYSITYSITSYFA